MNILMNRNDIDLDDNCSWTIWKKANNKFDLQQMTSSVYSPATAIEERWSAFLLYAYSNRQQRDHIKELRSRSSINTFVVAQIDFLMNYTLIRQREVQQGSFSQHQVTIFTVHLTIGQQHRNLAIINDCMEHSTAFVHCAQKRIVQFLKYYLLFVKKIKYVR